MVSKANPFAARDKLFEEQRTKSSIHSPQTEVETKQPATKKSLKGNTEVASSPALKVQETTTPIPQKKETTGRKRTKPQTDTQDSHNAKIKYAGEDETITVPIRLTERQIEELDKLCGRRKKYKNRSEAVRDLVNREYGIYQ